MGQQQRQRMPAGPTHQHRHPLRLRQQLPLLELLLAAAAALQLARADLLQLLALLRPPCPPALLAPGPAAVAALGARAGVQALLPEAQGQQVGHLPQVLLLLLRQQLLLGALVEAAGCCPPAEGKRTRTSDRQTMGRHNP